MRGALLAAAVVLAAPLVTAPVQGQDSAFAAAVRVARRDLRADSGRLWGVVLDTIPWLGVAQGRLILTADPGDTSYGPSEGVWVGPLPAGMLGANTSIAWAGRRWAMVVLPLNPDSLVAARLLIHEAMHVLQPAVLPKPVYNETGAGTELLDGPIGRTWLRLELRALAVALADSGPAGRRAVRDAVAFHARRSRAATAVERERERALELVEGLPEYSAWRLSGATAGDVAVVLRAPEPEGQSFVRRFAYLTGPAYGFLLDREGSWRGRLTVRSDLATMLREGTDTAGAEVGARTYGVDSVRRQERARWVARERELTHLRAAFVSGPTLRLRPRSMRLTFDPRVQSSLGAAGTVMGNLTWKGDDGAVLTASSGGLVSPDWAELRVPLGGVKIAPGPVTARTDWSGDGWQLTLPAGWVFTADSGSVVATPPAG
jgi:hypothetical protein